MINLPFIHLVQSPMQSYFYDVNTNQNVPVSNDTYTFLQACEDKGSFALEDAQENVQSEIKGLLAQGFLSSKRPIKMKHPESDFLEYHLEHNLEYMILQLTQQCNFRCSYCVYSQNNESQRNHSSKRMDFELAKKCIDFFVLHSRDQLNVLIGLYGGEPLLEFELIKKIVDYAEKAFEGKKLTFGMTTNGSLLTEKVVDFLSKHNFDVTISLDGPPEIHDRSRKFAVNGKGTFSVIANNISNIKKNNPEFHKKLHFNVVIDPRFSLENLYGVFDKNEIFKDLSVRSSIIDDSFSMEKVVATREYLSTNAHEEFLAYLSLFGRYPKNSASNLVINKILSAYKLEEKYNVPAKSIADETSHGGPCIPGKRRLFINVDGDFFPCERVSETSLEMNIGNINSGFYLDKAMALLNICELTEKECKNCWAINKCTNCARVCDNNGELSRTVKLVECKKVRISLHKSMEQYITIQEMKELYGGTELD